MTTVSAERLSRIFVEVADTLVDDFDLLDFLHMLTLRTASLVGASAVGVLLADQRGHLRFMAASDEQAKVLEIFQVQVSEGPCFDAFRTATPVLNTDLRDAVERWPAFSRHAIEAGFRSVHAFPIRVRREVIELRASASNPAHGIVRTKVTVLNQADEAVMTLMTAGRVSTRQGAAS